MRLIVIGALIVGALAIALLYEVTSHTAPASMSAPATARAIPTPAAPEPVAAVIPAPPSAARPAIEHARTMPATHVTPMLPAVAPTPDAKPKHIDTPTDIFRWSVMRAIRNTEPAVIDCLDKAKAAGTPVDGRAVFAFFVTTRHAKAVIDRPSVDTSPYPEALNTCILGTLASGELDQQLPEGQPEFRILRELIVEKGAITTYKLKSYLAP